MSNFCDFFNHLTRDVKSLYRSLLSEFGRQPEDTLGVIQGNAGFNAYVTYSKWPGMSVQWEKEVDGEWVNATENWYVVQSLT